MHHGAAGPVINTAVIDVYKRQCYAYVAFQTAYLKCHYPSEFMAALLTSVLDNTDKVIEYSGECARLGIKVLPPDVNVSNGGFTADDNGQIRFGPVSYTHLSCAVRRISPFGSSTA